MKPLAIAAAAALLALPTPALAAQAPEAPASEALVERFLAVLPDRDLIDAPSAEIDAGELSGLLALNPGREAELRKILEANLACTAPAITAGTLRMLRSVARDLGEARLQRLVSFYEGPDFAAFNALAGRMRGNAAPSAEDEAAMARLMNAYPLKAYHDGLDRADAIIAADGAFMTDAMKCAEQQMQALEAAGLKSH